MKSPELTKCIKFISDDHQFEVISKYLQTPTFYHIKELNYP